MTRMSTIQLHNINTLMIKQQIMLEINICCYLPSTIRSIPNIMLYRGKLLKKTQLLNSKEIIYKQLYTFLFPRK